jgi:hypothetical protein
MERRTYALLCVDPGTTHLAMGIFLGTCENDLTMAWNMTYAAGHDPARMVEAAMEAIDVLGVVGSKADERLFLVEFQAPMGRAHVARWNAYVEGVVTAAACLAPSLGPSRVCTVNSSACKRRLGLATGNYAANKQMSLIYARKECPSIGSHHVADCYVLARYWMSTHVIPITIPAASM